MKLRRLLGLVLLIVVSMGPVTAQDGWTSEVIGQGIKPSIAVDASGAAHVAYLVADFGGELVYSTNVSGAWQGTGVSEGYFYGPVDIALSGDGTPTIVYHDEQSETFDPALGDVVAATFANGSWQLTAVEDDGNDGWDADVAIDSAGAWHISSIDPVQFGAVTGVEYATNAYGDMRVEEIGSGPQPYEFGTSIRVRDDGVVGITYSDERYRDLIYAERSPGPDGSWSLTTVDAQGDVGRYPSLAYDSNGNPHITYFRDDGGTNGTVRYAWRDGRTWQTLDIGTLAQVVTGIEGARKITAIALDNNDSVHLVYGDQQKIVYARLNDDGTWTQQNIAESQSQSLGQLVELALDNRGVPQIVYYTVQNRSPLTGDVIYARAG